METFLPVGSIPCEKKNEASCNQCKLMSLQGNEKKPWSLVASRFSLPGQYVLHINREDLTGTPDAGRVVSDIPGRKHILAQDIPLSW
jgi:hypothetical protein